MMLRRYKGKEKVLPAIEEPAINEAVVADENQRSAADSDNAVIEEPAEDEVADTKQKSTKKK